MTFCAYFYSHRLDCSKGSPCGVTMSLTFCPLGFHYPEYKRDEAVHDENLVLFGSLVTVWGMCVSGRVQH